MAKIVCIDDAPASTAMMQSILAGSGHSVTAYNSPLGVEDKISADQPELVFLDIIMPERNGYEVLRALRRNSATKDIPVVLVSSKSEETDVRWGLRQGAVAYVTKPYTAEDVLGTLRQHLK